MAYENIEKMYGKEPAQKGITITYKNPKHLKNAFYQIEKKEIKRKYQPKYFASILMDKYGVVMRPINGEILLPYILDKKTNTYKPINTTELISLCVEDMGEEAVISLQELKKGLDYITKYVTPTYNIVHFQNGILNMDNFAFTEKSETPVLALLTIPYNYNTEAAPSGEYVQKFLQSSFEQDTPEATQKYVEGILQLIGYLFVSGNPKNRLLVGVGVPGSGKGVLTNILGLIFNEKVANISLQDMSSNRFATSSFLHTNINIINDVGTQPIKDNGPIKELTGNNPIMVEPKGQSRVKLPAEEVPKTIMFANELPYMKQEAALWQRFIIFEFKHSFRGKETQDINLFQKIKNNKEELEWLIKESIRAYKTMVGGGNDFILATDERETQKLTNKHNDPIVYIIDELFEDYEIPECDSYGNPEYFETEPLPNMEVNKVVCAYAEKEGITLPLTKKGLLSGKRLTGAIRRTFELDKDEYNTTVLRDNDKLVRVYRGLKPSQKYINLRAIIAKDE